jgi:hypothetical protein
VPQVDLVSENFVVADPAQVAAAVHDERFWAQLWPGLRLSVFQDRGHQGIRWSCAGALTGSCEVWLEGHGDGVIVHCYLRADLPAGRSAGRVRREARNRHIQVNRVVFALKDRLEGDRPAATACRDPLSACQDLPTSQE